MSTLRNVSIISPELIGREIQLSAITNVWEETRKGHSHIMRLAGEAGIGKSRLTAEIKKIAAQTGAQILQGRCFEQDRAFPYAPIVDLLRTFCASRSGDELAHEFSTTGTELIKVFPELSVHLPQLAPSHSSDPDQEKRRIFQALVQFILGQAGSSPLLLILEDLHWCDDTSLEWLLHLTRQLTTQPILIILTYRNDEVQPTLNETLAALDRFAFVHEFGLARFTRAELEAMILAIFQHAQPPRREFLDALYSLTDGNPLFIEEVLKSLVASGDIYQISGKWTRKPLRELQIPRTVHVAVQQRTKQLGDPAREVLTIAAVVGQRFDFSILQSLTGKFETELVQIIKELLTAQLVTEEITPLGELFAFRHALTREAIYNMLLGRERKNLHRAVATTMEAGRVNTYHNGEIAHHYFQAGLWDQAYTLAKQAGYAATHLFAYHEALEQFTRARQCAEMLEDQAKLLDMHEAIGETQLACGYFQDAITTFETALPMASDSKRRAAIKGHLGNAYLNRVDAHGVPYLQEALAELDPTTQTKEIALAMLWMGHYYELRAQFETSLSYFERAYPLIEQTGDTPSLRLLYSSMASVMMNLARFEESIEWSQHCIRLGETTQYTAAIILGYYNLSVNAEHLGRWQEVRQYAELGSQHSRQSIWQLDGLWTNLQFIRALYYQGELLDGLQKTNDLLQLALSNNAKLTPVRASDQLAQFHLALGDEQAAYQAAHTAVQRADAIANLLAQCRSRLTLASVHLHREEWEQAEEICKQCLNLLSGTENHLISMRLHIVLAEAQGMLGDLDSANRYLTDTIHKNQATKARHYEAQAWRVHGRIHSAQADSANALRAFDQAIALCNELDSRLELAYTLYQRGELHHKQGQLDSARADWLRACELCEQMGARGLLWQVHAALGSVTHDENDFTAARAIVTELVEAMSDDAFRENLLARAARVIPPLKVRTPRQTTQREFGGLSEREREVAGLIAQGKSNREIAETLVLSERTVTTHISHIFSKLGFTSRAQVARWAGEKGLDTTGE